MKSEHPLWQAIRWPLLVLLVGVVGVATATILEEAFRSEWSLTIGAPSLWLLATSSVWLLIAVVAYLVRRRRTNHSPW